MNIYKEDWNTLLHTLDQMVESYKYLNKGEEPFIMPTLTHIVEMIKVSENNKNDHIVLDETTRQVLSDFGLFEALMEGENN